MLNANELVLKLRPLEIPRLRDLGDILQYALPWAALAATALVQANQVNAWRWLYIGITTVVLTSIFKYLFNFTPYGERPDGGDEAMPSGHTSSAFMGAAFFHFEFGITSALIPYLLAAVTGYSRIYAKRHWPRDVIAGAMLGIMVNYAYFFEIDIKVPI